MTEHRNRDELAGMLMGEMLLFGLLGKVIYAQPDQSFLQSLIDEDVFSEAPFGSEHPDIVSGLDLLSNWCAANRSGISPENFLDLQAEYTRLFVGTGRVLAPLWESVYFNEARLIFQEQTLQVRKWFRSYGLEPEKLNSEPDDHIGLEMAFVSHLANLGLQALDQGDDVKLEELLAAQRQFMSEHLLRWGSRWCSLVEENAKTDFYRGLSRLTLGALLSVAAWLEIGIPADLPG